METESIRVAEYFSKRDIFITGSTGILGKVLLEKLLRSCPDINRLYLLMREKKGKFADKRIHDLRASIVFDKVREIDPTLLDKLQIISGDVTKINLGISPSDTEKLKNVSIFCHIAANIRFDDPLKNAIIMNVRGTRESLKFAEKLPKLDVFLYTSTMYSNPRRGVVDEKIYPTFVNWQDSIQLAETLDENILDAVTVKYTNWYPNTYSFTKGLAEQCVMDFKDRLPICIFRPSIIVSSIEEPFAGWFDAFVGPIGLVAAINTGLCRTVYSREAQVLDYMPIDMAIRSMILAIWERGCNQTNCQLIYNCSSHSRPTDMNELLKLGSHSVKTYPLDKMIWLPNAVLLSNRFLYTLHVIFGQLLVSLALDYMLWITGNKPLFVKLQRNIFAAQNANEFFTFKRYHFKTAKFWNLGNNLHPDDRDAFDYKKHWFIPMDEVCRRIAIGVRKYMLKESDETLGRARRMYEVLFVVDKIFKLFLLYFGYRFLVKMLM